MITPFFKLEQDEQFIIISIKAKYIRISEVEYFIDKNNFRFSLKPYFLNLNFSHYIKDSEKNSSKYDVESGILVCKIEKENFGEAFENLDLLSNLMADEKSKKAAAQQINKIEEIQGEMSDLNINNVNININNDNAFDEQDFIQKCKKEFLYKNFSYDELNEIYFDYLLNRKKKKIFSELKLLSICESFSYGFNNQHNDVFSHRQEELLEISDLNPEKIQSAHRFFEKMNLENNDFIPERYIGDLTLKEENPEIFEADIKKFFKKHIKKNPLESLFTEKEQNTLLALNKIKLNLLQENAEQIDIEKKSTLALLSETQLKVYFMRSCNFEFYLQVIDLLFAFLYDFRINDFEANSESGWNINKLSSMLSCHVNYKNVFFSLAEEPPFDLIDELLRNLIASCFRRVLCYPLYRSLDLCVKIQNEDLAFILENGKSYVLKCLLDVRIAFERAEPRFILNQIYVDQLIRWVQVSNESVWKLFSGKVKAKEMQIEKEDLKLNLKEIEEEYI